MDQNLDGLKTPDEEFNLDEISNVVEGDDLLDIRELLKRKELQTNVLKKIIEQRQTTKNIEK